MSMHNVKKGDLIVSKIHSRIWIDIGEMFVVEKIVISEITHKEGVQFFDRTGSKRVFWNVEDYSLVDKNSIL